MFDHLLIHKNKLRSAQKIKNSDFFQFIHNDLMDRLEMVDKTFEDVLCVGWADEKVITSPQSGRSDLLPPEIATSATQTRNDGVRSATSLRITLLHTSSTPLDLIYFPFGLHWVNDVQKFLAQIKSLLKKDGVFICNFPAAGSLANLRKSLFLAEEGAGTPHFPHISPFIKFEDSTALLQQAGFAENIIDQETITLEYDSPLNLMKALKNIGESNAIASRSHYSIPKSVYKFLQNYNENIFEDEVKLVTLIASPTKGTIRMK
jgi:NADH dehydrogenase [ubiquinone] 1 alpha subcomplex assembly factor 5